MTTKVNYYFVRHGFGCHNAIRPILDYHVSDRNHRTIISSDPAFIDPLLTPLGVNASIQNGCAIGKLIKTLARTTKKPDFEMSQMNVVGCSPLLRSMETAYYMTRKWRNPPNKIYVFPHLREIDERSTNKYSPESKKAMNTEPSYMMKSIEDQKLYLQREGILQYFDFRFVESNPTLRDAPGDVLDFVSWFSEHFAPSVNESNLNVFVITHAGVLRDYAKEGFINNSGFALSTTLDMQAMKIHAKKHVSFNPLLPSTFFKNYTGKDVLRKEYHCPSNRCGQICSYMRDEIKTLRSTCSLDNDSM